MVYTRVKSPDVVCFIHHDVGVLCGIDGCTCCLKFSANVITVGKYTRTENFATRKDAQRYLASTVHWSWFRPEWNQFQ